MTRLTVTLYGSNITSIKVVMLLQDLDNGNDRCWANGWLHGQGLALEGRLKAHPGRCDCCSQRYSNRHPQWYLTINATIALCVYPHCKVSIGQYTKMCTAPLIFFQFHSFRWQIFEENIWLLSLSLYIWPLESWTIIAIIRFNSILRTIWGRVEC